MSVAVHETSKTCYVYDLDNTDRVPDSPCSAKVEVSASARAGEAAALRGKSVGGDRAHVALLRAPRGGGCSVHACMTEKFYYVLQGRLSADIDGRIVEVPAQHALHVPAGMPHAITAVEDTAFIVAMAVGAQAADVFECVDGGWRQQAGAMTQPLTRKVSDGSVRYVYAIDQLDAVPAGISSAKVVPKNYVSGKSSSFGAALSGAALHVGVIHKARGSGAKLHTHPNEQFNVVLAGKLLGEIDGAPMEVTPYGLIHMPAGIRHCTAASAGGDLTVFVVKDTSHGLSGPPVDGVEDGPRYLPGFGPKNAGPKNAGPQQ